MGEGFVDYVGDIYVQDGSNEGTLGSFCWAPVLYTHTSVNVVRPLANDPADENFGKYTVQQIDLRAIAGKKSVPFQHRFPDNFLKLELGEDLFVIRGKVRPVVVLFNPRASHEEVIKDGAKSANDIQTCFGCVPSYTLTGTNEMSRHKGAFVENVRALKYAPFCYLPKHPQFEDRETFLRLDRLTWIPPKLLSPMEFKLNSKGMKYLSAWNDWFCRGIPLPNQLSEVRNFFLELLEEERKKVSSSAEQK
ncbi:MAG TPA: hypothetical protein VHX86_20105 [Tepidisphaeraceae bacterium]|jgi:hypothetical protein|nr:hypothetical protein [Tepidisphaeraceae bacterium]